MSQTLVLLHGWGLNSAVWDTVMPKLTSQFDVKTIDLPGFGGQPWQQAFTDIHKVADTVAADISASCAQPVVLAGWSMGGLVATLIALRHPQLVARLHTIASSPCFVARPAPDSGQQAWPGIAPNVLTQFSAQLATDTTATVKRFLAVQAMGSPHARNDVKILQKSVLSRPLADPQALASGLRWLAEIDLRHCLRDLGVPLHRAYGRLDTLVPVAVGGQVDTGSEVIFQRSAHAPFLNQPDDFCHWLLNRTP